MGDLLPSGAASADAPTRWELIRDLAVFQLKLVLDALRDVVLSPVSLVAGVVDLIRGGERPGRYFYQVLLGGRRSEAWINLWGEADRVAPRAPGADAVSLDAVVERMEQLLVEQVERGLRLRAGQLERVAGFLFLRNGPVGLRIFLRARRIA